ncbi:DUF3888 domain-containing protein [Paenibacillus physcomitrellae]|uniref:DUF3888 domain-containing protein n=1 Tax=Paenibacillus physcomitrellae TaxID=1619311 RepID=A0ABQ1GCA5_9BACL|nr:DUF3888 domain-containing protein [Paenibacillus physcomitrellae]GGA41011.1 hypothetical protein GCM10010917_27830 [Paenibacillus physcomitrellae]
MKRTVIISLTLILILLSPIQTNAEKSYYIPQEDSTELRLQDMLMNFINPYINDAIQGYYQHLLRELPLVYPYFVDMIESHRVNGFRGFILSITLDVTPVIGPHISVGKDRLTFEISAGPKAKLVNYTHLKTYELPTHWQDIIKKPKKY